MLPSRQALTPPNGDGVWDLCGDTDGTRQTRHWGAEQNGFSPRERLALPPDSFAEAQNTDIIVLLCSNHCEHPEGRTSFLASWLSTKTLKSGNPD